MCRDRGQQCCAFTRPGQEPIGRSAFPGNPRAEAGGDAGATRSRNADLWDLRIGLDGLEEAGENGYGDGDVAGGDEDGEELGEALQPGRVDGMAEAEGLKHTPEAVIEVIAEHAHGDDVEERDGPNLEAGDYIVVDVVFVERPAGVHGAEGEVQKVKD